MHTYRGRVTLLGFCILFLLAGCGLENSLSGKDTEGCSGTVFEGMIYEVSRSNHTVSSILVIKTEEAGLSEEEWYGKEAVVFSLKPKVKLIDKEGNLWTKEELRVGLKIRVQHSGELMESYPMQGSALCVQVLDDLLSQEHEAGQVVAETEEGDFALQLVSEKKAYKANEDVSLHAQLKYVGNKSEEMIYHAASPFWFTITEITKGITIPYAMDEPLILTTLKRGEWYAEEYKKAGGYSEIDPSETKSFIRSFLKEEGFPTGEYRIELEAKFFTEYQEQKQHHALTVSLEITVD